MAWHFPTIAMATRNTVIRELAALELGSAANLNAHDVVLVPLQELLNTKFHVMFHTKTFEPFCFGQTS